MNDKIISPKILHIDDSWDFLNIFKMTFKDRFDITSAKSGAKALEMLKVEKYDVIISDYEMAGMNGLELLRHLKKDYPDLPVIFYTGQGNEAIAREAFIQGASDYFTKEIFGFAYKEKLINSIHRAIEIRNTTREKRESEEKYRNLVDLSPDPIVILQDDQYQFVNSAFTKLFGYDRHEVENGLSFFDLVQEKDKELIRRQREDYIKGKSISKTYRINLLTKNGELVNCETSTARISYKDKPADLVIIRDITGRKRAEERMKRYREQLSILGSESLIQAREAARDSASPASMENPHLVDGKYSIRDLVDIEYLHKILEDFSSATGFTTGFVTYPDQGLLFVAGWQDICKKFHRAFPESEKYCKKSNAYLTDGLTNLKELNISYCELGLVDGVTPIVIKGKHVADLYYGQVLFEKPNIQRFREQAETFGFDTEAYIKALKEVPVVTEEQLKKALTFLSEMATLIAEQGLANLRAKENATVLAEEIAERRQMEDAKRESEERFRTLVETTSDWMWEVNVNWAFTYSSPRIRDLLGYGAEQAIGKSLFDLMHSNEIKRTRTILQEMATSPEPVEKLENIYLHKDGRHVVLEISAVPVLDSKGETLGYRGIGRDVTDRKQAEKKMEHLNRVLRAIRNVNQLITQENDIDRLLHGVCNNLIENRGYDKAWIVLLNESGKVVKFAEAGMGESFSKFLQSGDGDRGLLYAFESLDKSGVCVINDLKVYCMGCPVEKVCVKEQIFAVRLEYDGEFFGFLSAAVPKDFVTDKEEQNLFKEVAGDISYALHSLEVEKRRHKSEEELKRTNELLKQERSMFISGPVVVFKWKNQEGWPVEYVSPNVNEVFGYSVEEFQSGKVPYSDIICKENLERVIEEVRSNSESGAKSFVHIPYKIVRKDGKKIWIADYTTILRDEKGEITHYLGYVIDVTFRNQAEERLRLAAKVSTDLIYEWDIITGQLEWFGDIDAALGYQPGEFPRTIEAWVNIIHPDDRVKMVDSVDLHMTSTEHIYEEYRIRRKDGKWLYWLDRGAPVLGNDGLPIKWIGGFLNITEQKDIERQLSIRNRELNNFAYRVSHDLKGPISIIRGYGLSIKDDPSLFNSYFDRIIGQTDHLVHFINRLLKLSRAGKALDKKEKIDLKDMVQTIFLLLRRPDIPAGLTVDSPLPEIIAAPLSIKQLFANLIQNSIKYRDLNKETLIMELGHKDEDDNIIIYFRDNGSGIKKKYINKVFSPGFVLSKDTGTGFGLAIIKRIMEAHGGKIWAKSEGKNKGTTFYLQFPKANQFL